MKHYSEVGTIQSYTEVDTCDTIQRGVFVGRKKARLIQFLTAIC